MVKTTKTTEMSKYQITLPVWFNEEIYSMTDQQIAGFVRMQAAVCEMQKECDEAEQARQCRYKEIVSQLPWWLWIKHKLGQFPI